MGIKNKTAKTIARQQRQAQRAVERKKQVAKAGSQALTRPRASRPNGRLLPRWVEPQAGELALLNRVDDFSDLRNALRQMAADTEEWAGIPMPLDGERLIIEPTYKHAEALGQMGKKPDGDDTKDYPEFEGWKLRSSFWSTNRRSRVVIYDTPSGKVQYGMRAGIHHLAYDMATLGCADAWGVEQEQKALMTLGSMLRHRQFKQYLLTGMFMESSKRSGLSYLFRRLKPTVAISFRKCSFRDLGKPVEGEPQARVLAALCCHPIGFYEGSWAGAMCPTDDVVAHLTMMRGDERLYWARANQHAAHLPEAGL